MKLSPSQTSCPAPAADYRAEKAGFASRVSAWIGWHPVGAILLVSVLAVVINCYPVIFCGRSFVSPACTGTLVYDWWPPAPGMSSETPLVRTHGSDVWAMILWAVPVGFVESRSVLENGELPLWNRYSHAGDTLIGQAVSMLGDPLQWIVILGHGSAGAWDLKFLSAKFLFCAGFGLLILRLSGNRFLALIFAALAAYCGAFFYIAIHPVFFVFCYAPWVLLCALAFLDARSVSPVKWGLAWLLAAFADFNAGHVETAVVLIAGLNLAAVICALMNCRSVADVAKVLSRMAAGTLLFLGLTAPVWASFFAALDGSYSTHSEVKILQLPIVTLAGVVDDLFYHLPLPNDFYNAVAPGASLLVMAGCIISMRRWRQMKTEPFFWVNGGAVFVWAGCVFGWVPARLLSAIPLLNRVGHVDVDFSYLLIIHLTIQSAYGFLCLAQDGNFRRALGDVIWTGLVFAVIAALFCVGIHHRPLPWGYFLFTGGGATGALLLFAFLKSRFRQISALGWIGIIVLGFCPQFRFGQYHFAFANEDYLLVPGPRSVLNAPSRAIDKIKADRSGPFRAAGVHGILHGDYSAVYGLEDIRSCAPLSNGEYIHLVRNFPGMTFNRDWVLEIVNPFAAQPLLNLLNVKYLLTPPQVKVQDGLDFRLMDRSDLGIVENLEVWPRAFFTDKITSAASTDEFIQLLLANGKKPFAAVTPEEIKQQPGLMALETTNPAAIFPATNFQLRPNSTAFDVHASAAGIVCLTEGQARDFTATANREPKPVLTVNRAFKGVYLDQPGDYHIEFVYRPRHWLLSCALFWVSVGACAGLALTGFLRAHWGRKSRPPFGFDSMTGGS